MDGFPQFAKNHETIITGPWPLWVGLLAMLLLAAGVNAAVIPVGQWEYSFIWDRLERLETQSANRFDYQLGPYRIAPDAADISPFDVQGELGSDQLNLFGFVGEKFTAEKEAPARGFESIRGGFTGAPHRHLFLYANFVLDEEKAEDEDYTGKKYRGLVGDIETAFIAYENGSFEAMLGRYASFWGPRNSLALSSGVAMDGFGYRWRWGRFTLSYRLARLDGLDPERYDVTQFENRYFAGHRLDCHLGRGLRLGIFETAVFGGPGRQIDLFYLNPLIFYHGAQLNEGTDDNTFVGFDFTFKPKKGIRLYGQMLIDDYQVDDHAQTDKEPSELGFIVGGHIVKLVASLDVKVEYSRVNNWTFNQILDRNRYLYSGQLIGGADGNDYDLLELSVLRWLNSAQCVSVNFAYRRQGEGEVMAEWTAPWLLATGEYDEPFPSGTVEKTASVWLNLKGIAFGRFFVDLQAGLKDVGNSGHISGDNRQLPFFGLRLSSFFSALVDVN